MLGGGEGRLGGDDEVMGPEVVRKNFGGKVTKGRTGGKEEDFIVVEEDEDVTVRGDVWRQGLACGVNQVLEGGLCNFGDMFHPNGRHGK